VTSLPSTAPASTAGPLLAGAVARKKAAFDRVWAEEIPTALSTALHAMKSVMREMAADPVYRSSPLALHALAQALKDLAEIYFTVQALEHRLGGKI
jgi:hypothetical protein